MKQLCLSTNEEFEITEADLELLDRISPKIAGKTFSIPPPKHCPEIRLQRRLVFRNERYLYTRPSDLSGKRMVSIFSPDSPYKVFDQDEWWSDKWDGISFGIPYQPQEDFFEQLNKLARRVPHIGLFTRNVQNSYYSNYCLNTKDCYLVYGTTNSEDCFYGKFLTDCRDCFDCLTVFKSELCYQSVCCSDCYNCKNLTNCRSCIDCDFCQDCQSCKSCIGCYGLISQEFCIFNENVGKVRYQKYLQEISDPTPQILLDLSQKFNKHVLSYPRRANYILACENCTGDSLYNCKDCQYCFDLNESEHSRYTAYVPKAIHCLDCTYGAPDGIQYSYQLCSSVGTINSMGTFLCWFCDAVFYCMECQSCKNCLGCIGLRNKEYCIFNRQFSKQEYEKLAAQIIASMQQKGTWGEYFPVACSYFAYNETLAQEYFPLSKEEAEAYGYGWRERPEPSIAPEQIINSAILLKRISELDDSNIGKSVNCHKCQRFFRFNPAEINFYREQSIPLPRECPDCRHLERLKRRNPPTLWERKCAKTGQKIWTSFNSARPEIIYSNKAWEQEFLA